MLIIKMKNHHYDFGLMKPGCPVTPLLLNASSVSAFCPLIATEILVEATINHLDNIIHVSMPC